MQQLHGMIIHVIYRRQVAATFGIDWTFFKLL